MNGIGRNSEWALIGVLLMLVSCATDPYYEAAPISPTNVAPVEDVNIAVNARTTFSWLPTENTQFYEFHIYNQNTKDTTQYRQDQLQVENVCSEGRCSLTLNVDLPTSTGHAWRVRAGNNAGLSDWNRTRFNMIDASVGSSDAPARSNDEEIAEASAEVNGEPVSESGVSVELNADTLASADEGAGTIGAAVENSEAIPTVELVSDVDEVVEPDTSELASSNAESDTSDSSSSSSEQDGPDLMQPVEDKQFVTGSLIDFKWRSLPDAVSYDFYIYDSVSNEMVESLTDVAAVSVCPAEDVCVLTREVSLPEANHSWRVRANYKDGASPFSSNQFAVTR